MFKKDFISFFSFSLHSNSSSSETDIKEHNIVSELNNSSDRENTERFKFFEKIHIFVIILFPRQRLCLMAFRENETKLYAFAREERKSSSFFRVVLTYDGDEERKRRGKKSVK
jgi:hypothetical protein